MKRRGGFLFFRIFTTFLVAATLIVAGLGLVYRMLQPERKIPRALEENIVIYFSDLQQRLQNNPDEQRDELKTLRGLEFRQATPTGDDLLANTRGLPTFAEIEQRGFLISDRIRVGRIHERHFLEILGSQPRTVWFSERLPALTGVKPPFFVLATFVFVIMALSFLSIRWIMHPLRTLLVGVEHLANGDLSYRVPEGRRGEFHMIAKTFNLLAERLESMISSRDRLLRDVSHELRSPMTRISVATDMLNDEKLQRSIREDLLKMNELIDEILESYRIRDSRPHLKLERVNVTEILNSLRQEFADSANRLTMDLEPNLLAEVDAALIRRALRNLIENAIKYSPQTNAKIEIKGKQEEHQLVLSIRDHGIGFDQGLSRQIFEPFFQVDAARTPGAKGFGLGLSIVKSIVDAHQGEIFVHSAPKQGSEFILKLPVRKNIKL